MTVVLHKHKIACGKHVLLSYICCRKHLDSCNKNDIQMILQLSICLSTTNIWTASSEFGTYRLCEQRRFRRACASAQSCQNLRCSLIQAVSQEEPSDRKPDPWPLWMAGHAQLKCVMTECSKTQIRLTQPICKHNAFSKCTFTLIQHNSHFATVSL